MQLSEERAKYLLEHPDFSPHLFACARELQHGTERLDQLVDLGAFPGMPQGIVALHGGAYRPWHIALLARACAHMNPESMFLCTKTGTSRILGDEAITESEAIVDAILAADTGGVVLRETFLIDPQATNTGMEVRMMRELPDFSCRALCSKWHARRVSLTWQREAPALTVRVIRVHTKKDDIIGVEDIDPLLREAWKIVRYPACGFQSSAPRIEEERYQGMLTALSRIAPDVYAWLEQEIPV
jgi:hypothetical protein